MINNLQDPEGLAVPFFSCMVTRRTKQLILTVEFTAENKPIGEVLFKVKAAGKDIGNWEVLKFDPKIDGYTKTIDYPRKGWQYIISWEKNS